jgi:hypothetical protein
MADGEFEREKEAVMSGRYLDMMNVGELNANQTILTDS